MRRATSAAVLLAAVLAAAAPAGAASRDVRAEGRAAGGDRALAVRVAHALLALPPALQLTRVRCERADGADYCGLTLSGVKFHRRIDLRTFTADVDALVHGAFAVDPAIAEVDLWVTVPAGRDKGMVSSGDFDLSPTATVYATTVPRGAPGRPSAGASVFWDPAFRLQLEGGSLG